MSNYIDFVEMSYGIQVSSMLLWTKIVKLTA